MATPLLLYPPRCTLDDILSPAQETTLSYVESNLMGRALRFLATLAFASIAAKAQSVSPTVGWQSVIENTSIDTDQVYKEFQNALNAGNGEFQKAAPQFKAKAPGYLLIDVQAARRAGISAIGRF